MDDEWNWRLVRLWLDGFKGRDERGRRMTCYLSGRYEQIARDFLGGAVRRNDEIPNIIRHRLAGLIEVENELPRFVGSERKFEIKFRNSGRRKDENRDEFVHDELQKLLDTGMKVEAAVQTVCDLYEMKRSEVFRIYRAWHAIEPVYELLRNSSVLDGRAIAQGQTPSAIDPAIVVSLLNRTNKPD